MARNDNLFIASCVHVGANEARLDLFKRSLKTAKDIGAGICLIGDLLDVGSFVGTQHTGSVFDNCLTPDQQIDAAIEMLQPYVDNIEIILPGNHEERLHKAAGLKLNKQVAIGIGKRNCYRDTYTVLRYASKNIFLAHGASPSDFKKVMAGHENIDVIALGHTHELSHKPVGRITHGGSGHAPVKRTINHIRCGTYLDEPRYGKTALYEPNLIGGAWISVDDEGVVTCDLGWRPRK